MANATSSSAAVSPRPAPFLKWAGGKGQLLAAIRARLPRRIDGVYREPFVGGGAVFFDLAADGAIRRAALSDANVELVDSYLAVRDEVEAVIEALAAHKNDGDHYYRVRGADPASMPRAERAARTIFLNRVGFNGLYRVNASGKFNVPFGRHASPRIVDAARLRAASRALSIADITVAEFTDACDAATAGDVVYLDPPYVPVSKTSSFTAYAGKFGEAEHRRLAETFARLVDVGAYALLSNSDTPFTRELYAGFDVASIEATRSINSKADRRGVVKEILVRGIRLDAGLDARQKPST